MNLHTGSHLNDVLLKIFLLIRKFSSLILLLSHVIFTYSVLRFMLFSVNTLSLFLILRRYFIFNRNLIVLQFIIIVYFSCCDVCLLLF